MNMFHPISKVIMAIDEIFMGLRGKGIRKEILNYFLKYRLVIEDLIFYEILRADKLKVSFLIAV